MKFVEFKSLRLNDAVIDDKGHLSKAYDIDRNLRAIKIKQYGNKWYPYQEVRLPEPEDLAENKSMTIY